MLGYEVSKKSFQNFLMELSKNFLAKFQKNDDRNRAIDSSKDYATSAENLGSMNGLSIQYSCYYKTRLNRSHTKRAFCDVFETIFKDFPLQK